MRGVRESSLYSGLKSHEPIIKGYMRAQENEVKRPESTSLTSLEEWVLWLLGPLSQHVNFTEIFSSLRGEHPVPLLLKLYIKNFLVRDQFF